MMRTGRQGHAERRRRVGGALHPRARRSTSIWVLGVAAALLLSACGADGDGSSSDTRPVDSSSPAGSTARGTSTSTTSSSSSTADPTTTAPPAPGPAPTPTCADEAAITDLLWNAHWRGDGPAHLSWATYDDRGSHVAVFGFDPGDGTLAFEVHPRDHAGDLVATSVVATGGSLVEQAGVHDAVGSDPRPRFDEYAARGTAIVFDLHFNGRNELLASNCTETSGPLAGLVLDADAIQMFTTLTGNISCAVTFDAARCDVREHSWTAPPPAQECILDHGDTLTVRDGVAGFGCVGDATSNDHALGYGAIARAGDHQCIVAETGVRCEEISSGAGFSVSRESYSLF